MSTISTSTPITLTQDELPSPPVTEPTPVLAATEELNTASVVEETSKQSVDAPAQAITEVEKPTPVAPKRSPFTELKNRFFAPKVSSLQSFLFFEFLFFLLCFVQSLLALFERRV
jgi:hypothetical protein